MIKKIIFLTIQVLLVYPVLTNNPSTLYAQKSPLESLKLIGDKLVAQTPFRYRIDVAPTPTHFDEMSFVDFGRTFGKTQKGVAYAYTELVSSKSEVLRMEFEHNDALKIWLNGELIYQAKGAKQFDLHHEERSLEMSSCVDLALVKGRNKLLFKSENMGSATKWALFVQPPSNKGAVLREKQTPPLIGLTQLEDCSASISQLSNWLVVGPFKQGIDNWYPPESGLEFGKIYESASGEPIAWTIPKIEILGNSIDAKEWGTNYDWNYHNGGVAWAMYHLSKVVEEPRYKKYADDFCNFHLQGEPFVRYQVSSLNYVNSANHFFIKTPLLDFTLAPSMPFIYRLIAEPDFDQRHIYEEFVASMLKYAESEQIRLPGSTIYTRVTPETYTTWVDDMFMGIPFLIQASLYSKDLATKKAFLDDAANQVLGFNDHVWDKQARLYMHANYSQRPQVRLPHWSRANGWGIWATTEVLQILPKRHPNYKSIVAHYREHVESLVKYQNERGFWYNVLDYPDSREEVSGTAIFTMAVARGVTNGWLDAKKYAPVAEKGWGAIETRIESDGTVRDICYGTMCSEDVDYYKNRPFYDNDTHGLFAVLFAGIEVHKMRLAQKDL